MNRKEVETFLLKIKANYQNFSIESYIVDEWYGKLKNYDILDVYNKLDKHLNGEYANTIPQLHFITKFLKTKKEKETLKPGKMACRYCGTLFDMEDDENWDKCEERCRRILYLKNIAIEYNLTIKSNLDDLNIEEIDVVYEKMLRHLLEKENKLSDRERVLFRRILGLSQEEVNLNIFN